MFCGFFSKYLGLLDKFIRPSKVWCFIYLSHFNTDHSHYFKTSLRKKKKRQAADIGPLGYVFHNYCLIISVKVWTFGSLLSPIWTL